MGQYVKFNFYGLPYYNWTMVGEKKKRQNK